MDCDELTKQCIEDGGKPSKCGKCRGRTNFPCNHGIRPTIACVSGRVNANENATGMTARVCEEGDWCFTMNCFNESIDANIKDDEMFRSRVPLYTIKGCSRDEENDWTKMDKQCKFPASFACEESCCNGGKDQCDALYQGSAASTAALNVPKMSLALLASAAIFVIN
ncbi:hypothetical protein niasHS_009386 [Heterodera schachtii]|uniref:Uncharacterized protein n=1 Tax=Heterodera schachtii TaxID=97005 RepID=A0ABD2JC05_HETSC